MRRVDQVRLTLGAKDLLLTRPVAAAESGRAPTRALANVQRVLGVRQVVQAVVVDRTGWTALGALVDVLHGTSMLALAAVGPTRLRRWALTQAAIATGLIVAGAARAPRR